MKHVVKGTGLADIIRTLVFCLVVCLIVVTFPGQSEARRQWYEAYGIASKRELTAPSSVPKLMEALSEKNTN